MVLALVQNTRTRIYQHRARWTARKLSDFIQPSDHVLDVGAGDCRLDLRLTKKIGCQVTPVDVEDFNMTDLKLTLFDGRTLPFADGTFDVVLLIFVLHHAQDPQAVLTEAARVCRGRIIVFEDVVQSSWDRLMFRSFHKWLAWSERISYPFREWLPERWTQLAAKIGLRQESSQMLGRQLGYFGCRHVGFVWSKNASAADK